MTNFEKVIDKAMICTELFLMDTDNGDMDILMGEALQFIKESTAKDIMKQLCIFLSKNLEFIEDWKTNSGSFWEDSGKDLFLLNFACCFFDPEKIEDILKEF